MLTPDLFLPSIYYFNLPECVLSSPVMLNSLRPLGLQPIRLLSPWNFSGKYTEVGCHYSINLLRCAQNRDVKLCQGGKEFTPQLHQERGRGPKKQKQKQKQT